VRIPLPRLAALAVCLPALLAAQPSTPLIRILSEELDRNFRVLREKADPAPYFIGYSVTDTETASVSASQGALRGTDRSRNRFLDVSVRVGSPELDNYRRLRGDLPQFTGGASIVIDDQPDAIRRRAWLETDRVYRLTAQRLANVKTNQQVKVAEDDKSGDFSAAPPATTIVNVAPLKFNAEEWQKTLRRWSADLGKPASILSSNITVIAQREVKTAVNTEGTRLQHGRTFARIIISAQGKAADGMNLATSEILDAEDPARLPNEKVVRAAMKKVETDLLALLKAPLVEPFVGPAILSGKAAGVFFHEIFGHRIEGHRQRDESEGQTFAKKVGDKILPDFLSVQSDPTRHVLNGTDLNGWYDYDDEAVKARPVTVVDKGVLRNFLMSRAPIAGFQTSNGHGRREPGREVVPRQSNLIVESSNKVTDAQLRQALIAEIKKQGKPYGLYFEQVSSGFTMTQRRGLQAFAVVPLVVYRVYPDGRPDELVRGADIVGTPLAAFAKIAATSDKTEIFNGYCGAESGSVPVSAVSPALLVTEVEIQKKERSLDRPPLLPPPSQESAQPRQETN